jgi:hypothetical protein
MKEAQRRLALAAWIELSRVDESRMDPEAKYFEQLRRADAMERADLITGEEWRKLVQHAGDMLSSPAQRPGGSE